MWSIIWQAIENETVQQSIMFKTSSSLFFRFFLIIIITDEGVKKGPVNLK